MSWGLLLIAALRFWCGCARQKRSTWCWKVFTAFFEDLKLNCGLVKEQEEHSASFSFQLDSVDIFKKKKKWGTNAKAMNGKITLQECGPWPTHVEHHDINFRIQMDFIQLDYLGSAQLINSFCLSIYFSIPHLRYHFGRCIITNSVALE